MPPASAPTSGPTSRPRPSTRPARTAGTRAESGRWHSERPPFTPLSRCAQPSKIASQCRAEEAHQLDSRDPRLVEHGTQQRQAPGSCVVENCVAPVEHRLAMAHADQVAHQLTGERRARGERRELGQFGVERHEVAAHGVQQVPGCFGLERDAELLGAMRKPAQHAVGRRALQRTVRASLLNSDSGSGSAPPCTRTSTVLAPPAGRDSAAARPAPRLLLPTFHVAQNDHPTISHHRQGVE